MSNQGTEAPAPFEMLGDDGATVCGPDGCAVPTSRGGDADDRDAPGSSG